MSDSKQKPIAKTSAFTELGLKAATNNLCQEIRELYLADDVPWIIGYSGGKDSTATLQLVWMAIAGLEPALRKKTVYVISTDTMVENPVVAAWVTNSLNVMKKAAKDQAVPIIPSLLRPNTSESFWVNLIGKGYPAPRPKFRWCTERLKIRPSNRFISQIVSANGEAVLCLGARKAESVARAKVLEKNSKLRIKDRFSPSSTLPGCMIYTPIESWSNDDVWKFLMQVENAWGHSNRDLLGMYAGASADGECPLVVDDSTPSCGDSRFGCWVCTLVEKDKSMTAMIQNDSEKEWMAPLLELRNSLDHRNEEGSDHHLRDFRRMSGAVQVMSGGDPVPGPYTQKSREEWLRKLLGAQTWIRKNGPADVRSIELITLEELQEIRRIWVVDKHELEDLLPRVYHETTEEPYPGRPLDDNMVLDSFDMSDLQEICSEDRLHYELTRELLGVQRQQRSTGRRSKVFELLEKTFRRNFYDSREDALAKAKTKADSLKKLEEVKQDRLLEPSSGEECQL